MAAARRCPAHPKPQREAQTQGFLVASLKAFAAISKAI